MLPFSGFAANFIKELYELDPMPHTPATSLPRDQHHRTESGSRLPSTLPFPHPGTPQGNTTKAARRLTTGKNTSPLTDKLNAIRAGFAAQRRSLEHQLNHSKHLQKVVEEVIKDLKKQVVDAAKPDEDRAEDPVIQSTREKSYQEIWSDDDDDVSDGAKDALDTLEELTEQVFRKPAGKEASRRSATRRS